MRDKRLVAASFSRAAQAYDGVAQLQRDVANRLANWLPEGSVAQVLDLGSGTGYANKWLSDVSDNPLLSLDLAEGMVRFSKAQGDLGRFVVGDAESLPLRTASIDLIWSSLALQWSEFPAQLFSELERVLKPGGRLLISTLGRSTLFELRAAWAAADQHEHVNSFFEISEWLGFSSGLELIRHESELNVQRYPEVVALVRELKTLGAHNVNPQRRSGLGGQRSLKTMIKSYEGFRGDDGLLPASYETHYLEFIKR